MSWSSSAKIALWASYSALIEAMTGGYIAENYNVALPTWDPQTLTEIEPIKYLNLLQSYLWFGKTWSDVTRQMMIEVLHYYRHFIYNWYADPNWPIAQQLAVLSNFVKMLELASAYQLSSNSQACQSALQQALEQLRYDLNQWVNGAYTGDDINAQIVNADQFIKGICK